MASGKYNNRAYVSNAPGAFYHIAASDFGVAAPTLSANLTLATGSGSLATGTTAVEVTWITNEGVSLASASETIATITSSGVTVTQPTLPAVPNGGVQNVIGWQIYSATSTGTPASSTIKLNTLSTVPAPVNITTTEGTEVGFPVATTSVLVKSAGTGSVPSTLDNSGIQQALPAIQAQHSVEYYAVIPNAGSQWKQQKHVDYMNPDGISETLGIVLHQIDFIQPVYPGAANQPQGGANPPSSTYTQVSVAPGTFMVMNGYLFEAVQAASGSTAAAFIGFSKFNLAKGSQTTDNNVTWQSYGKAGLARFQFSNISSSTATPAVRGYELFQL